MKISPLFRWSDLWVGLYIDRKRKRLYLFPVPMLGVCVSWAKPEAPHEGRVTLRTRADLLTDESKSPGASWADQPQLSQADMERARKLVLTDSRGIGRVSEHYREFKADLAPELPPRRPGREFARAEAEILREAQQRADAMRDHQNRTRRGVNLEWRRGSGFGPRKEGDRS